MPACGVCCTSTFAQAGAGQKSQPQAFPIPLRSIRTDAFPCRKLGTRRWLTIELGLSDPSTGKLMALQGGNHSTGTTGVRL